jgi:hypothetical protein
MSLFETHGEWCQFKKMVKIDPEFATQFHKTFSTLIWTRDNASEDEKKRYPMTDYFFEASTVDIDYKSIVSVFESDFKIKIQQSTDKGISVFALPTPSLDPTRLMRRWIPIAQSKGNPTSSYNEPGAMDLLWCTLDNDFIVRRPQFGPNNCITSESILFRVNVLA